MINMVADLLCHRTRTDCPGPFRNNGSPRGGFYFVQTLVTSALLNIHSDKYYLFHLICMRDLCYYINDIWCATSILIEYQVKYLRGVNRDKNIDISVTLSFSKNDRVCGCGRSLANESTGKSFFRMLIEKKWRASGGKMRGRWRRKWKGAIRKIHGRSCTRG